MKNSKKIIPSVNFHLWEPCNFKCKFCFATFQDVKQSILPMGHLPKNDALQIIDKLADAGFSKITFVGGEPTLCPWIGELIIRAKVNGLTTMIVSNGIKINEAFFKEVDGFLDWAVLSIDSLNPLLNKQIGRFQGKINPDKVYYEDKIALINAFNVKLKINTVVNRYNYLEDELGSFIEIIKPERWKVIQALRVKGQNDASFDEIKISNEQFYFYLHNNKVKSLDYAVIEENEDMKGTYMMVDPAGRFFDNTKGYYTYSSPILEVGVQKALSHIIYDFERFVERGGLY